MHGSKEVALVSEDSFLEKGNKQGGMLKAWGRSPHNLTRTFRGHILSSKLVQPLEELSLHLQVLHNGLYHQVCAVDNRRCICAGC